MDSPIDSLTSVEVEALRSLTAHCWAWGAVMAFREAGGIGYPSLSDLHGQRYRPIGGMSLSSIGAAFTDVERWLRGEPPLLRGILYFQYARPLAGLSVQRSLFDYVDFVFGEIDRADRDRVVRAMRRVRRRWLRGVLSELMS